MKELQYPFDPKHLISSKRSIKRKLLEDKRERFPKKIAVLGGSTTSDIIKVMELFLLNYGIQPEFYECEYSQFEQEALFPSPGFSEFKPDIIFIHTSGRNIRQWPSISDSEEAVNEKLASEISRFKAIWRSLEEKFCCPVIQNNFELPYYRLLGNMDAWDHRGRTSFTSRLNAAFAEHAAVSDNFFINDINYLSADFGLKAWADPYYWNMYKYCLSMDAIPYLAFSVSNIIKALFGRNKKALALDLDNTLWGGVVGDDGQSGIEIGQENGTAQSYYEFQQYIKSLKDLGILLTVCSKNDEENALEGLRHPEGALAPEDFVNIKANWDNKDLNIRRIAEELNIFEDSIVFVDDNPAERAIVEAQLPGVEAPLMDGVENYIAVIDRGGYFETTSLSADDMKRSEMYMENALRSRAEAQFADYGEYLKSLEMEAEIRDFSDIYIARITQLTNKSNQFNLTTRRYSPDEMDQVYKSPDYIRLYGKLTDRFGDNGVVAVVIGRINGQVLDIDLWLMSCRVLKRDMELAMLDTLVKRCKEKGIAAIKGYYYPTKKNGMVKDLYERFGFTKISEDPEGNTVWELSVSGYTDQNRYIQVNYD